MYDNQEKDGKLFLVRRIFSWPHWRSLWRWDFSPLPACWI